MPAQFWGEQEAEKVPAARVAAGCQVGQSLKALSSVHLQQGPAASSRPLDGLQCVEGTEDVRLPLQVNALLVNTVLRDSSTSVHLPDTVCNINGDFFCRHSLGISFGLLKRLTPCIELVENI